MTIVKLAFRGIRANLGRLILTTLAIVAGVTFVTGALVVTDSLSSTINQLLESATASVDAQVQAAEPEFGTDEQTIPDTLVDEVAALDEVGEAVPFVLYEDPAEPQAFAILGDDGERIGIQGPPVITFSWDGAEVEGLFSITEGAPPVGIDQAAIEVAYAEAGGIEAGDTVTMTTPDGDREVEISTIIDIPVTLGAYFMLFDFPSAQTLYDKEGLVDGIELHRTPGVSTDEMIASVAAVLPAETEVIGQEQLFDDQSQEVEGFISIFRWVLVGFALVAIFVSLFIIYNTFAILVNQRMHQIGMLRAIGATKRQIRTSVIIEALLVGIAGSILGFAAGVGVAWLIKSLVQSVGAVPEASTVIEPRTIIVAVLIGVVSALLSALIPSFRAARISPVAAMRNEPPTSSSFTRKIVLGAVVLAIGLVLIGLGVFNVPSGTSLIVMALGVGAVLTFIGVALLSVLFAGPIVSLIGRGTVLGASLLIAGIALPVLTFTVGDGVGSGLGVVTFGLKMLVSAIAVVTGASILGTALRGGKRFGLGGSAAGLSGQLARQNAARAPQRTAATATALTIGIALVSMVGTVGESIKASFADVVDRALTADLFIYSEIGAPIDSEVVDQLATIDGVGTVSGFQLNEIRVDEEVLPVAAMNGSSGTEIVDLRVTDGSMEGLSDNGLLLFTEEADDRGYAVGDTVSVEFPNGEFEDLEVVGTFEDNAALNSPWIIDIEVLDRHVDLDQDVFAGAALAEGADLQQVQADVTAAFGESETLAVQNREEYQETTEGQIDFVVTVINYLLAFALIVAFIGVINTIVLSVLERTREIGLLRAVGMTRRQVRSTIRWESVIVCLFGAALGIVLGVVFATAAVSAIPDSLIADVAIPYESVLFTILVAALAGVVAAILPAYRASKLNVLEAIATPGG